MQVALVNHSSVVADADVARAAVDLNTQMQRDVSPAWGTNVTVFAVLKGQVVPAGAAVVAVLDNSDQAGALGYHDITAGGLPLGKVFAKDDARYGLSWTVTASHEIIEMAIDPDCVRGAQINGTTWVAYEACLAGDTKISLLNGTEVPISEIRDDSFWVYACDKDGRVVPAKAHSARITGRSRELVKVILDDGEHIRCTPDHRFMLRDGSFKEAAVLSTGESLMPLYRRNEPIRWGKTSTEYQQVLHPVPMEWEFTHRMVAPDCPNGSVRHHQDFDRFNNDPTNIQVVTAAEHNDIHVGYNQMLVDLGLHPFQQPHSEAHRQDSRLRMIDYNKSPQHRRLAVEVGRRNMTALWENPKFRSDHSERSRARVALFDEEKRLAGLRRPEVRSRVGNGTRHTNHVRWHEKRGLSKPGCAWCDDPATPVNHSVLRVESVNDREDVWDITVDEHHNFALSSGIFVHNCDPCEADRYGYLIGRTLVSDFVLPNFFQSRLPGPYDFGHHITRPLSLLPGGYIAVWTQAAGWTQRTAREADGVPSRARTASRIGLRLGAGVRSEAVPEALVDVDG